MLMSFKLLPLTELMTKDMMFYQHLRKNIVVTTEMRMQFRRKNVLLVQRMYLNSQGEDKSG